MNKLCAGCSKPVYFAERKTSLGREWHPSCLKCVECGKVLSPGQHAEHKGMPYCHHPCYRALFGPAILGYGSNISSPANFAPRRSPVNISSTNRASTGSIVNSVESEESLSYTYSLGRRNRPKHHLVHQNSNGVKKEIFSNRDNGGVSDRVDSDPSSTRLTSSTNAASPTAASPQQRASPVGAGAHAVQRSISHGSKALSQPLSPRRAPPLPPSNKPPNTPPPPSSSSSPQSLTHSSPPPASGHASQSPSLDHPLPPPTSGNKITKTPNPDYLVNPNLLREFERKPLTESGNIEMTHEIQETLLKLADFNRYYEGKVHGHMTAQQREDGGVHVEGPLRIYWGLSRPIQLAHCDNIPPAPISQWRHSLHVGPNSPAADTPNKSFASMSLRRTGSPASARRSRELDDLLSPTSPDDVVRRKKTGVRKFKTVAYRGGNQPSKWKRASINGHIFNFDTSVFTPVLGSCTSVTVDGTLNSLEVIETLLDKFKVQNSADEYVLSIVNEEGERLLTNRDHPLMERLKLGPDESIGKIFIKEREVLKEEGVGELVVDTLAAVVGDTSVAAVEDGVDGGGGLTESGGAVRRPSMRSTSIKIPIRETEEEENLPHEVEQLLVLPEAVLKGLLVKYHNDEEMEVRKVRARYEVVKQRMTKTLHEVLSNSTSSTA